MFSIDTAITEISAASLAFEGGMDPQHRKQTGSYYTSLELTLPMMRELVGRIAPGRPLYTLRFLEPCVGTGSFVFAYLLAARALNYTRAQYRALLDTIYACDINAAALAQYKRALRRFARGCFGISLSDAYFDAHTGAGLLFDVDSKAPRYISLNDVFGEGFEGSFDIVATNPPYKNLKAERGHYRTDEDYRADKKRYAAISGIAADTLHHSTRGVMNLYKLFVEEIIERYSRPDAMISLLVPASILTDKTCERLRARILSMASIHSIKSIAENNRFVDAKQALCAILLEKGGQAETIEVSTGYGSPGAKTTTIPVEDMLMQGNGNMLLVLDAQEYRIFRKMSAFPRIKQLPFIINRRGELDLTTNKDAITEKKTRYPLLRGRNIGYYALAQRPVSEYVEPRFVKSSAKRQYIKGERIICQQISNMAKQRRLVFAPIPSNYVLGNSCNYIAVDENEHGIDLLFLLGILNSSLMNWFFKLQSSNNHINNYEIDSFPIPVDSPHKKALAAMVAEYLAGAKPALLEAIEALVRKMYLDEADRQESPVDRLAQEKQTRLAQNGLLNHTTFKLSDLDLEMIRAVPQGGSWKDIPQETVQKSKRLIRINETGGRTTLYGRIAYDAPSYTITTYFNRPGNGTYVHPIHDRVLSVREAARLQAFPDHYFFCGNKTNLLKQVGNAVPPVLAYQLAKEIASGAQCETSLDLFCGAGGMTYGFRMAGIRSLLANDIEPSACLTLKTNCPQIDVICGDVTSAEIKSRIVAQARGVDIVCGGPPCQGFSMAGHRLTDDPRNRLFLDFIDIVDQVAPKVVVFENVEGLLSFQGGETYRCIHQMFDEIGYDTHGRVLLASLYGVAQRRRRVFIICTRKDLALSPADLFPPEITAGEHAQITAHDAIADLQDIACGEDAAYAAAPASFFAKWARGHITMEDYIAAIRRG